MYSSVNASERTGANSRNSLSLFFFQKLEWKWKTMNWAQMCLSCTAHVRNILHTKCITKSKAHRPESVPFGIQLKDKSVLRTKGCLWSDHCKHANTSSELSDLFPCHVIAQSSIELHVTSQCSAVPYFFLYNDRCKKVMTTSTVSGFCASDSHISYYSASSLFTARNGSLQTIRCYETIYWNLNFKVLCVKNYFFSVEDMIHCPSGSCWDLFSATDQWTTLSLT